LIVGATNKTFSKGKKMFDDDRWGHLATPSEAAREYAWNVGADNPHRAWILTDYDSWESNPFYHGEPVPHPEYEY
jgi:hypothetical protein